METKSKNISGLADRPPIRGSLLGVHSIEAPKHAPVDGEEPLVWRRRASLQQPKTPPNSTPNPDHNCGKRRASLPPGNDGSRVGHRGAQEVCREPSQLSLHLKHIPPLFQYKPDLLADKVCRNPLTGECYFEGVLPEEDFCLVDLWQRESVASYMDALENDVHYFRVKPLLLRTWLLRGVSSHDAMMDDNQLVAKCLAQNANDLGIQRHTVCYYLPMFFTSVLTGDLILILLIDLTVFFALFLISYVHNFMLYRFHRYMTMPLRLCVLAYVVMALPEAVTALVEHGHPYSIVQLFGFLGVIMFLSIDFYEDLVSQMRRSLECSYTIVSELPERVYVVRAVGSKFHDAETMRLRRGVKCAISGISDRDWDSDATLFLVANVYGVLCLLFPMTKGDWKATAQEYCQVDPKRCISNVHNPVPIVRIGAYSSETPTFHERDFVRAHNWASGRRRSIEANGDDAS